jgi:hypothetical protein
MLKDRRILLENECAKVHALAAKLYLEMIVNNELQNDEYDALRTRLTDLKFELNMVKDLIVKGHV